MKLPTWIYIGTAFLFLTGCGPKPSDSPDPAPPGEIVLKWDQDLADLDLYVVTPNGQVAYADLKNVTGGVFGEDDTTGLGPEYFDVTTPQVGNYTVKVNYHWHNGQNANVTATIKVYRYGVWDSTLGALTHTFTKADANSYSGPTPPSAWVATSTLTFP